MSTIQTVKTQIQSLIDLANTTTGNQDTNLTDGVNALVGGYGQGGSAALNIHYGDTEPSDTSMLWCKCDTPSNVLARSNVSIDESLNSTTSYLPNGAYGIGVGAVGTKIYLFGGNNNYISGGTLSTINVFDTETESISTLSVTLPTACYGIGIGVVGTKIYLFGGKGSSNLSTIYRFQLDFELTTNTLLLQTNLTDNIFKIVSFTLFILS